MKPIVREKYQVWMDWAVNQSGALLKKGSMGIVTVEGILSSVPNDAGFWRCNIITEDGQTDDYWIHPSDAVNKKILLIEDDHGNKYVREEI